MKITVFGDVMCEEPILKASKKRDGTYNFDGVFEKVKPMFEEADYVITNLEFPIAGADAKYTKGFFSFNAPVGYAEAAKRAGVDLVSTANNHTLDRGVEGVIKTINALDEIDLPHTGTFLPEKGREEAYYFNVEDTTFAVVAYTYSTNTKLFDQEEELVKLINYLRPFGSSPYKKETREKMNSWVDKVFSFLKFEDRGIIKKIFGIPAGYILTDDNVDEEAVKPFIEQFVSDIETAKKKADFVICYPHTGGQFNPEAGEFSEYVIKSAVKAGADAVFASHSHMVQKAEIVNGVPCAYSLGNFSMSPNSIFVVKECLPDYGIAMHLYIEGKKVEKVTYSILKGVEKRGKQLISWPVDELYKTLKSKKQKKKLEEDVCRVYKYITGQDLTENIIRREYVLK